MRRLPLHLATVARSISLEHLDGRCPHLDLLAPGRDHLNWPRLTRPSSRILARLGDDCAGWWGRVSSRILARPGSDLHVVAVGVEVGDGAGPGVHAAELHL